MHDDVFGGTYLLSNFSDTSWQARAQLQTLLLTEDSADRAAVQAHIAHLDAEVADLIHQMDEADTDPAVVVARAVRFRGMCRHR